MAAFPKSIAASIHGIARRSLGKDWQLYGILLEHWPTIVGDAWADLMIPVKLAFPSTGRDNVRQNRRDGVMTIRLPRGLALEAQYQQPQIIARINHYLGSDVLCRLIFVHTTDNRAKSPDFPAVPDQGARDAAEAAAGSVDDLELRAALSDFGAILMSNRLERKA